jgi:hypothetical protein
MPRAVFIAHGELARTHAESSEGNNNPILVVLYYPTRRLQSIKPSHCPIQDMEDHVK